MPRVRRLEDRSLATTPELGVPQREGCTDSDGGRAPAGSGARPRKRFGGGESDVFDGVGNVAARESIEVK